MDAAKLISEGRAILGIEFGSTRIKAVLIDEENHPIATGSHAWENCLKNHIWTYSEDDIITGMQLCYQSLRKQVEERYHVTIHTLKAIGISGMMHGYLALDTRNQMLVPFRTWRNTITEESSEMLTEMFEFHIPQRWSIAHLGQAVLNDETHVDDIVYLTTLSGYIHLLLTGEKVLGIGDASGMFPIDTVTKNFDSDMIKKFNHFLKAKGKCIKLEAILPTVMTAGQEAGCLTGQGAGLLDISGNLQEGIRFCPPEGDAGTGMTATNSVEAGTGNVSAGTSAFAMVVLEKELKKVRKELDIVTTPDGKNVAMVQCNNCTSDINVWIRLFQEFAALSGHPMTDGEIYPLLFQTALDGEKDCGGLLSFNYFSGEHITGFEEGRPLTVRTPDSRFNLSNFMRSHLFAAFATLKIGLDILVNEEQIEIENITGHGGFFKTPEVGQRILATVMNVPVITLQTAGEGGAWGIALLAAYMVNRNEQDSLSDYLKRNVFGNNKGIRVCPDEEDVKGFEQFMTRYQKAIPVERAAVENISNI